MTRVIHTGDTHLGYQQYHVPERRADFMTAFRRVIEDAVEADVDAVVHAGDLFHDRQPALPDILGAIDVLRTLDAAAIPFLAVVGNHESKREAQWLDLFASLGLATRLGSDPVTVGDVAVYGLDYVPRARRDALELAFEPHEAAHAALVTHGLFQPFDFGTWDIRDLLRRSEVAFDAVLLGDNHDPGVQRVAEPTDTWVTYCGSTERASADERDNRGYNIVSFEDDIDIRRRGLETREFVYVDVSLEAGEGIDRVRERVSQHDVTEAVVIVTVDGDGDPIAPADIERFALDRGALVARVTDRREFADETAVEVSFADPDAAVTDRLRDMGLSEAAREIDETVRASDVPDSKVAAAVEERVREVVEDGDPSVFVADESSPDDDGDADADATAGGGDEPAVAEVGEVSASADDGGPESQVTMEEYL